MLLRTGTFSEEHVVNVENKRKVKKKKMLSTTWQGKNLLYRSLKMKEGLLKFRGKIRKKSSLGIKDDVSVC